MILSRNEHINNFVIYYFKRLDLTDPGERFKYKKSWRDPSENGHEPYSKLGLPSGSPILL